METSSTRILREDERQSMYSSFSISSMVGFRFAFLSYQRPPSTFRPMGMFNSMQARTRSTKSNFLPVFFRPRHSNHRSNCITEHFSGSFGSFAPGTSSSVNVISYKKYPSYTSDNYNIIVIYDSGQYLLVQKGYPSVALKVRETDLNEFPNA